MIDFKFNKNLSYEQQQQAGGNYIVKSQTSLPKHAVEQGSPYHLSNSFKPAVSPFAINQRLLST